MGVNFAKPPVNEVVIGQVFVPRTDILIPHVGEFWVNHLRESYPECTHAAPVVSPGSVGVTDPETGLPLPRVWFIGKDPSRMVQWQQDRLYTNWRQLQEGDQYVRFPSIRLEFDAVLTSYRDFVRERTREELKATGYQLTYVNVIPKGAGWSDMGDLGNVLRDIGWSQEPRFLSRPTKFAMRFEFALPNQLGKLAVSGDPAKNKNTEDEVYRFELAASASVEVVSHITFDDWLDVAHDQIVRGFKDLTTDRMHKDHWQFIDEGTTQ